MAELCKELEDAYCLGPIGVQGWLYEECVTKGATQWFQDNAHSKPGRSWYEYRVLSGMLFIRERW